jgi:autotransporter-associated beta strand protein
MKTNLSFLRNTTRIFFLVTVMLLLLSARSITFAGDATWDSQFPITGTSFDWNTDANWTPNTGYPGSSGTTDTATFSTLSPITNLSISSSITIGAITFTNSAPAFTITANAGVTLNFTGTGITTNSGQTQNFVTSAGGAIVFSGPAAGGGSMTAFTNNGNLDISSHIAPGVTIGSLEGSGNVFLGANNLNVGSNNTTTTFSGVMSGIGGSLTKTGGGTFTLSGANTYTGATTVTGGTLLVNGSTSSSSAVTVNSGTTLGGTGAIGGTVTVNSGANLSPGTSPGILNTGSVTLNSGSNLLIDINGTTPSQFDQLIVTGTVTLTGSNLVLTIGGTLTLGEQFLIINNDSNDAVVGTFLQGSSVTSGSNTFSINYAGGTGNDVVLTVVPEPSTWVAGFLAVAFVVYTQRRRLTQILRRA